MAAAQYAFATLLTSDSYLPGALTLAAALRDLHAQVSGPPFQLVCIASPESLEVSTIKLLRRAFDLVIGVELLEQHTDDGLRLLGRLDLNTVLTKLHVFRLTQFTKIIFLDADVLPLRPISHLFKLPDEFSAVPDVGWPDIFNSGVMVLTPGEDKFLELRQLLNAKGSWDGGDQGILNEWRGDNWKRLSFVYNTTPTAAYTYAPAYERFGSQISVIHFIGPQKPWHSIPYRTPFSQSSSTPSEVLSQSYDYGSLLDKWFSVYDTHFRSQSIAGPDDFQFEHYRSAWDAPTTSVGTVSSPETASAPPPKTFGLNDLRRYAIEGVSATSAGTSRLVASGEGEYRSLPLDGRVDLMRPLPAPAASQKESHVSPLPPAASNEVSHVSFLQPAASHEESHAIPSFPSQPTTLYAGHDATPSQAPSFQTPIYASQGAIVGPPTTLASHAGAGQIPEPHHTPGPNVVSLTPLQAAIALPTAPKPQPPPPVPQGGEAPAAVPSLIPPEFRAPLSKSSAPAAISPAQHSLPPPPQPQAPKPDGPPRPASPPPKRPPSPPLLIWNPAVEPPPTQPPVADAFPATYFPNVWDRSVDEPRHEGDHSGSFFEPPPQSEIPDILKQQGHYEHVIGRKDNIHEPDKSKVKSIFPWESRPRHMPSRVFPSGDAPSPSAFIVPRQDTPPPPQDIAPSTAALREVKTESPPKGLPTTLSFVNAWDAVPSIQRYASRLVRPPKPPTLPPAEPDDQRRRQRGSWGGISDASSQDGDVEDEEDDTTSDLHDQLESDEEFSSPQRSSRRGSLSNISASYITKGRKRDYCSRGVQTIAPRLRSQSVQTVAPDALPQLKSTEPKKPSPRKSHISQVQGHGAPIATPPLTPVAVQQAPSPRLELSMATAAPSPDNATPRSPLSPTKPARHITPLAPKENLQKIVTTPVPTKAVRQLSEGSTVSEVSSVGPHSPVDAAPFLSPMKPPLPTPTRKPVRVFDPARGVDVFKRGSESVLARFMQMGTSTWDEGGPPPVRP